MLRKFSPLLDMSKRADASSWHSLAALRREEQNGSDGQVTAWLTCLSYLHPRFPAHTPHKYPDAFPHFAYYQVFGKKHHRVDWCCSIILSLARSLSFSRSLVYLSLSLSQYHSWAAALVRAFFDATTEVRCQVHSYTQCVCVCVCVCMCVCVCV